MIRIAKQEDLEVLVDIAIKLFSNSQKEELYQEFNDFLQRYDVCVFLAEDEFVVGFALVQLRRDYVEGCQTSPVGYLEGIYVDTHYRNKGVAKQLLEKCEKWAKEQGCTEFASDCELNNQESLKFHLNVGFKEENRIICFKKNI